DKPFGLEFTQCLQREQVTVSEHPRAIVNVGETHGAPQPAAVLEGNTTALGQVDAGVLARAAEEDLFELGGPRCTGVGHAPIVPRSVEGWTGSGRTSYSWARASGCSCSHGRSCGWSRSRPRSRCQRSPRSSRRSPPL